MKLPLKSQFRMSAICFSSFSLKLSRFSLLYMFVGEHSSAFARSTADIFLLDSIKEFVAYAKRQGNQNADRIALQSADNAEKFIATRKIDSFESLAKFTAERE